MAAVGGASQFYLLVGFRRRLVRSCVNNNRRITKLDDNLSCSRPKSAFDDLLNLTLFDSTRLTAH